MTKQENKRDEICLKAMLHNIKNKPRLTMNDVLVYYSKKKDTMGG